MPPTPNLQLRSHNTPPHQCVALESTLLLHGVPPENAIPLSRELESIVRAQGATPATIAVLNGQPIVGITESELATLSTSPTPIPKANTANLGIYLAQHKSAATTVSTTMELAAQAGIHTFATGGLGGVHKGYGQHLDISADLAAFTRFPVAVVCSGVKSLLDVEATREALETLGIPVLGYQCSDFPAFYTRTLHPAGQKGPKVDARFDSIDELAACVAFELKRTGRGVVVCNPIPAEHEIPRGKWDAWLKQAMDLANEQGILSNGGRDVTPFLLGTLHRISGGETLKANLELVKNNARVAGQIAARLGNT